MFEVGVAATFEAAHRLRGDFGPATRLHGHTYRVELTVAGDRLGDDGTLVDIARVQAALAEVTAALHMRDLDEVEGLRGVNTTAERVAEHVARGVAQHLTGPDGCILTARVWESPSAWAACSLSLSRDGRSAK